VIAEAKKLATERGATIWESVSDTTRQPRESEVDGVDYNFVSHDKFVARMDGGYYLETAVYAENYYGTPFAPIIEQSALGTTVLVELEVQGVSQILLGEHSDLLSRMTMVFLAPPSPASLEGRLKRRGTDSSEVIARRMRAAKDEMRMVSMYDVVIINNVVSRAAYVLNKLWA
jgi:guanylate kinase